MGEITIIGAGLRAGQITLEAAEALHGNARILLHTERIGCADYLREQGIAFSSLDVLYDEIEDFDAHASAAAEAVRTAAEDGDVIYVVYDVRDRSVLKLSEMSVKLRVIAGPPVEGALLAHLDGATRMLEASDWSEFRLSATDNTLVRELNSRELASEVKLKLMECYPDETRVYFSDGEGGLARLPLYDLDRMKRYDHRSCVLIPAERDLMKLERYGFDDLLRVMHILQGPDGCPWDRAQTHESLRPYLLEEAYEAIDAINEQDPDHLYDELGDLLMQVVMHAEIGAAHGEFDLSDSLTAICSKMIRRHSHIFQSDRADSPEQVLDLWTRNKMKERGQASYTEVLREVVRSLPALLRAAKIQDKAARAGIAPADPAQVRAALQALLAQDGDDAEAWLGKVLFLVCAEARRMKLDPELALNEASDKFVDAFENMESELEKGGKKLPLAEKEPGQYWNLVKL